MLKLLPAWTDTSQCALAIWKLRSRRAWISPGSATTGTNQPWWMPVARIGEAKNPGPLVCTCNPGGWSRAEGLLIGSLEPSDRPVSLDTPGFSSFIPARGTAGRPSGGLAVLCKQAAPQQRMAEGMHWEAGRWAHYLLPHEGGLHIYNVYGYPSTDKQAPEKNRAMLVEIMGSVASLGKRPILLGGDWNFEPDDFPIDLVHGATVHRPMSDEAATSPVTHGEDAPDNGTKIDWFLVLKSLLPATGLEEALDYKPDHNALRMPVELKKVSQGFRGQPDYEDPTETDGICIANRYLEAKARHSGLCAIVARDVDLWCRAAEHALGLPVGSRGSLLLTRRSLAEPAPVEEAAEAAAK
eukprot:1130381-Amphidinium_carterae.2